VLHKAIGRLTARTHHGQVKKSQGRRGEREHNQEIDNKVNWVVSVYGDDIILNSNCVHDLIDLFNYCGFEINRDKSFFKGSFFESCGKHYFNGCDVTPIFQREVIDSVPSLFRHYNRVVRWEFTKEALLKVYQQPDDVHRMSIPLNNGKSVDLLIDLPVELSRLSVDTYLQGLQGLILNNKKPVYFSEYMGTDFDDGSDTSYLSLWDSHLLRTPKKLIDNNRIGIRFGCDCSSSEFWLTDHSAMYAFSLRTSNRFVDLTTNDRLDALYYEYVRFAWYGQNRSLLKLSNSGFNAKSLQQSSYGFGDATKDGSPVILGILRLSDQKSGRYNYQVKRYRTVS